MRFELAAAYAMGVGLPLLETVRRRTDFSHVHSYVDDFIAGALLLYAARAVSRGRRSGPVLLAVAWAVLCGGLYGSFFWQLASGASHDVGGLPNATVAAIKGALYAIALVSLVLASRAAIVQDVVGSGPVASLDLEGGCLCGRTRFRVSGAATNRACCHCRSCRGASGAPFVAWATFPSTGFTLTHGELVKYASSQKVVRGFCGTCGTALTYAHQARPEEIDVTLAALDDPGRVAPEFHIWVSHKLPWVVLADGLPQYAEWRQGA